MTLKHKKHLASLPILEGRVSAENITHHSKTLLEVTSNTSELKETINAEYLVVVLYGAPGAGKDTLLEKLISVETEPKLYRTRNATTRSRRPGEPEAAQMWMSEEAFQKAHTDNLFIEVNEHRSDGGIKKYGTLKSEVKFAHEEGRIPVLRVDPNGANAIRAKWRSKEEPFENSLVVNFCITPSHRHILYRRLVKREIERGGTLLLAKKKIQDRMPQISKDITFEDAHYILINHDNEVDALADDVKKLLRTLRQSLLKRSIT